MKNNLGNKRTMARNIQYYMDLNNKSRNDVCEILGIPYTTLTDWLKAKTYPRIDKIELLAEYFGILKSDLVEERSDTESQDDYTHIDNILPINTRKIPLLGDIACGEPIFAEEQFEHYVECGTDVKADFALRCKGDSMINARILDGDIVFIRKQPTVNNREIAAVLIEDEATLKRVYIGNSGIVLVAENPAYEPIHVSKKDHKNVRILGKAVAFQSDIK